MYLSRLSEKSEFVDFIKNEKYKNINIYLAIQKKIFSKNKNINYFDIDKNLFDFNSIFQSSTNFNNKKMNIIIINLFIYLITNNKINIYLNYGSYILLNLLYFILSTQKDNGDLYLIIPCLLKKIDFQILDILLNYYEKIEISKHFHYVNTDAIVLKCFNFKGITKKELEDFYNNYSIFYNNNIKNNIELLWNDKKIDNLYLKNIILNKIDKNLIKKIKNFNDNFYENLIKSLKIKIYINEFLSNKLTSVKEKKYVLDIIFKAQYKNYLDLSKKIC